MKTYTDFQRELKNRAQLMAVESGLCPLNDDNTFDTANFEKFWCLWKHDSRLLLGDLFIQAERNKRNYFVAGLFSGLAIAAIAIALTPILPALKLLLSR